MSLLSFFWEKLLQVIERLLVLIIICLTFSDASTDLTWSRYILTEYFTGENRVPFKYNNDASCTIKDSGYNKEPPLIIKLFSGFMSIKLSY